MFHACSHILAYTCTHTYLLDMLSGGRDIEMSKSVIHVRNPVECSYENVIVYNNMYKKKLIVTNA